jgi:hypothetical protein
VLYTKGPLKKPKAKILQANEAPMYTNTSSAIGDKGHFQKPLSRFDKDPINAEKNTSHTPLTSTPLSTPQFAEYCVKPQSRNVGYALLRLRSAHRIDLPCLRRIELSRNIKQVFASGLKNEGIWLVMENHLKSEFI